MLRLFFIAVVTLLVALPARAALRVVATVPDLAAVAKQIGGEHVQVTSLALHTQDPHWVDARPNLALELARADVLVLQGVELEVGWLPTLLVGSRNRKVQPGALGYVDCSRFAGLREVPAGKIDRALGDVHSGGNPHYTYDPREMIAVARGIAGSLATVDPEHAADYTSRSADFVAALEGAMARWRGELTALNGVNVVAYHRSLPYLADWLGVRVVAFVEPKPGIPPTPAHVARVLKQARAQSARLVLQEGWYPTTTTDLIAQKTGAKLVVLQGYTDFAGGQTYLEHVEAWVQQLRAVAG